MATGFDGKLADFQEKPERPAPTATDPGRPYASMGNCPFSPRILRELLEQANRGGDTDFGHQILPRRGAHGVAGQCLMPAQAATMFIRLGSFM